MMRFQVACSLRIKAANCSGVPPPARASSLANFAVMARYFERLYRLRQPVSMIAFGVLVAGTRMPYHCDVSKSL